MSTHMHFPLRAHIWQKDFFGFVGHLQRCVSQHSSFVSVCTNG